MSSGDKPVRLDEFDRTEWFDVARALKPGLTEQEYGAMWDEFIALKRQKELQ